MTASEDDVDAQQKLAKHTEIIRGSTGLFFNSLSLLPEAFTVRCNGMSGSRRS